MVDGLHITEGICGLVGGWIVTTAVGAKGHAEQLQALGEDELTTSVQSPLMVLAINVTLFPPCDEVDGLEYTIICSLFDDHWQELEVAPVKATSVEHTHRPLAIDDNDANTHINGGR